MGKFLVVSKSETLERSHFLIELGITTDKKRNFKIKPDLAKIFFIGNEKRNYKEGVFDAIDVYKDRRLGEVFVFDLTHLDHLYKDQQPHPFKKQNNLYFPNFMNGDSIKNICTYDIIKCVDEGYSVFVNNNLGKDLTTIFEYFNISKNLIDSFMLLSIILINRVFYDYDVLKPNKPSKDEYKLFEAVHEFLNNEAVSEYTETINSINELKEWQEIRTKVVHYNSYLSTRELSKSRKSKQMPLIDRHVNFSIKKTFKALVYVFHIRNKVEIKTSRKLAVRILAYFDLIEEFNTGKEFSDFYDSSIYASMVIDDKPFGQNY